ncbi:MAG: hypothetical protein ACPGVU_26205, partial [Limisphaerales bacterium]
TDLLEKILNTQKKAASALVTTNNEFRNHLKNMVINVDSSTVTSTDSKANAPPLVDFKALRRDFEQIEKRFTGTLDGLQKLTEQTTQSVSELSMALQTDRKSERKMVTEFQSKLRADLGTQADRLQKTISEISLPAPQTVTVPDSGKIVSAPVVDVNGPLNKWFNRSQELHDNLIKEIRGIGNNFTIPTEQLTKAADANVAKLRKILESFMIENARHDKQTEEFHRSLREDFQAHANLLGKVVSDRSSRDGTQAAPAPQQVSTLALDQSLKQWLGRTQELHESMLQKIQASGTAKPNGNGNGNGNGSSSEFVVRDLCNSIDQHQESLGKLLQDFMTENIQHNKNAEEFRSEMREDFRNQTGLLSQAVSGITRKLGDAPADSSTPTVNLDLEAPFTKWLSRTEEMHRSLISEIRSTSGQSQFPTNEFRQITDQHRDSLRKLLEDWTDESIRRVRATDELRAAIQQDIKTQADRLKQLAEARPTVTTGTATATADSEQDREWRESVQGELGTIIDKLDRMHDRMEEIFQI